MAHQDSRVAVAPDALASDRRSDDLAIFSAPGVDVVMHWWAESNRRWTERDRLKTPTIQTAVPPGSSLTCPLESHTEEYSASPDLADPIMAR